MTDYIVINELQVKTSDETNIMTWHKAMKGFGDDWRLPTREELNLLYKNRDVVGGFTSNSYWSSSESGSFFAWYQNFNDGYQSYSNKNTALPVRAVRAIEMEKTTHTT